MLDRPYVLTIAGLDPSAGAGLTADTKTFEQHKVYGLAICSGITLQTEDTFIAMRWEKIEDVLQAVKVLLTKYPIKVIKTGILPNVDYLDKIISYVKLHFPLIKIIVDPVFKASTGFELFDFSSRARFYKSLKKCYLITPNLEEVKWITGEETEEKAAGELAKYCAVFLKGGHRTNKKGLDYLYNKKQITEFLPAVESTNNKHGTGCVLSAAIASNLALGFSLEEACRRGKAYLEKVLESNQILLGYHNV